MASMSTLWRDAWRAVHPVKLLVGAPVRQRTWILPLWREHVLASCADAGVKPEFLFVAGATDTATVDLLRTWPNTTIVTVNDVERPDYRDWSPPERVAMLAALRNRLLRTVREAGPDLFLSLDTDILLCERTVGQLLQTLETTQASAVGGKAYMTPNGTSDPSYGMSAAGRFHRTACSDVLPVDIIMGAKLMQPEAYNVDYGYHLAGEDIYWSLAVKEAGGTLWWDGRTANRHVMTYSAMYLLDPRVDCPT